MKDKTIIEEKAQKLLEMTGMFCREYLDEDYKQLCAKLIGKMSRKRGVPFLSGRIEIWAAAVVYALGSINFLFDKSFKPYVRPLMIFAPISAHPKAPPPRKRKLSGICSRWAIIIKNFQPNI